ncbi:MAG: MaoC family dehydratase [Clostridia bacterium]|nr:MaoC family dehydratase [Clostridia bacterium]
MKQYTFEEIKIGQKETFHVKVTSEDQKAFLAITGDCNPLHCDPDYAKQKGYSGCVVYGMLTASYYSTLAGVWLPGEKSLIHKIQTKFLKPVLIGDELSVTGEVIEKNDTFQMITVKAFITNQAGQKVSKAEMQIGLI